MGKASKAKEGEEGTRSPPKGVKTSEPGTSTGSAAGVPAKNPPPQSDAMLNALTSISSILQNGFESLKDKVGEVNTNMKTLDNNMSKRFDDLEAGSEHESEYESDPQERPNKRQKHDVSDKEEGEVVEVQSEVLAETLEVIESDASVGPPVSAQIAEFVKKAFAKPLREDLLKKVGDRFLVPQNIPCLGVPRMNEPIYIKVAANVKNKDRAVQENQLIFTKVIAGLVKIADTLSNHEKEDQWIKDTMKIASEAITLSANVQTEWLKQRREDVKPSLPDDFKRLANVEVPLTAKNLFGDDLEGSIKTVESTNKIAKRMEVKKPKPPNNNNSNNNNNKSRWSSKKKKRFDNNNHDGDYKRGKKAKKDFQKKGSKN